ncbi:3-hydroxyisobutyryl-CoA hydrolase 1-like isoform X2 [Olea europaea var. sylvestris]|uniref:3-hydroxyisobutyryl-CoA hydrolase 1-like isoform X2 n=1 Tax=Olea europaea var. sylvestris TaxID=158386 RepID=UPI000C1D8742|nr:3-hydroxyisobutyryl-CoA hydrolase 1-like isoform X2 [Olea europaea var. sylvestris]
MASNPYSFGETDQVSRLLDLFLACEEDPSVKLIILKGKGRAFSAGGDVTAVVRDITQVGILTNWYQSTDSVANGNKIQQ